MPTPAELVTSIDTAIYNLVELGYEEVQHNGKRYRISDIDKLQRARTYYASLAAARTGPTKTVAEFN